MQDSRTRGVWILSTWNDRHRSDIRDCIQREPAKCCELDVSILKNTTRGCKTPCLLVKVFEETMKNGTWQHVRKPKTQDKQSSISVFKTNVCQASIIEKGTHFSIPRLLTVPSQLLQQLQIVLETTYQHRLSHCFNSFLYHSDLQVSTSCNKDVWTLMEPSRSCSDVSN